MYFVSKDVFIFQKLYEDYGAEIYYNTLNDVVEPIINIIINEAVFYSALPKTIYQEFIEQHEIIGNAIQSENDHFNILTVYKRDNYGKLNIYQIKFYLNKDWKEKQFKWKHILIGWKQIYIFIR